MEKKDNTETIEVNFPADLDYIPTIRRLISEIATVNGFTPKYAYRAEIIADEVCNNAVKFGSPKLDSRIRLNCTVHSDRVEMLVKDEGGNRDDLERLRRVIEMIDPEEEKGAQTLQMRGRGLEIVRMLSNGVELKVNPDGVTEVHVVKMREDPEV